MKKNIIVFVIFILFSTVISFYIFNIIISSENYVNKTVDFSSIKNKPKRDKSKDLRSGPEMEKIYYEQLHYPYGAVLDESILKKIWIEVKNTPDEKDFTASITSWTSLGPYGSIIPATTTGFTGRILDVNINDTASIKIAAASGGLWVAGNPQPTALTEQLTSQMAGSFDIRPGNSNYIVLGTGEPWMTTGTGLYITSNAGVNWASINLNDTNPSGFYKIRYSSSNVIHAASTRGYYRSDDNGTNWVKVLSGDITDVAVNPSDNNIIYCSRRMHAATDSGGVFKTTNNGAGWLRMSTGIAVTNVGRTSISIAKSNPAFVYVAMSKNSDGTMMGIYRTAGGNSWTDISPGEDVFEGIGWYSNEISVSPVSASKIYLGGVWIWRTSNLGSTWTKYDNNYDINIHSDQHAIVWDNAGNTTWFGNDGGLTMTDDEGFSFKTLKNNFPITQYKNVDVSLSNPVIFMGGSQDNGITSTSNNGSSWVYNISWGGDGSGAAINPFNPLERYMTIGVYGLPWSFRRHRSTDGGVNWVQLNNGIDTSRQWFTNIKTDNANPVTVYTSSSEFIYSSTNRGDNWLKRNPVGFADWISNFNVRKYTDSSVVYVNTISRDAGKRIYVQTGNGNFSECSNDITDGYGISTVALHPTNQNTAFAVISGLYSGQKVYKTTNRGLNWSNITNNLPNVSATDLTVYPLNDNIMYLGTEMGCYKTLNGGLNWFRWNDGLPEAVNVSQVKPFFSAGEFYILAGTYGRGMWKRKDDELLSISGNNNGQAKVFTLNQNFPNPFNPVTTIKFTLTAKSDAELLIYDIRGYLVKILHKGIMESGEHELKFDGSNYSSGVYFYKLKSMGNTEVRKMILVK